jgi:hypothetical protein
MASEAKLLDQNKGIKGDYCVYFAESLKIMHVRMKNAPKIKSKASRVYMGGRATTAQVNTIKAMQNVLGSHWEDRRTNPSNLTNAEAGLLIERNKDQYLLERAQGFCTVCQYIMLISICRKLNRNIKLERRNISMAQAGEWIERYKYILAA